MTDTYLTESNIYKSIPRLLEQHDRLAVATVTGTHGSAPQVPGSTALVGPSGIIAGTIGGGYVENAVLKMVPDVLLHKTSGWHHFSLGNDLSATEGSICGGGMRILLDAQPLKHLQVFQQLAEDTQNRIPGVMVTKAYSGVSGDLQIDRSWITAGNTPFSDQNLPQETKEMALALLQRAIPGECAEICYPADASEKLLLLERIIPEPRLLIAGAGHVGKALSHLGRFLGFKVIVWDDRTEFANHVHLPDADEIWTGNSDEVFAGFNPDPDTSIVIVTRGHRTDAGVLKIFLPSRAGYIGMIGSRKKILILREQFLKNGWATPEQWDRIHAPIGLAIGSRTVNEIALSIAAQLVQVRNSKKNQHG